MCLMIDTVGVVICSWIKIASHKNLEDLAKMNKQVWKMTAHIEFSEQSSQMTFDTQYIFVVQIG